MAIGESLVLDIERLVAGGEGLAFYEGRAVFVPFVLPGERVKALVLREQRDWARAELVEVLEASADRVEPECPLFGICGGCDLQMASYGAQREGKLAMLGDIFRRGAGLDVGGSVATGSGEAGGGPGAAGGWQGAAGGIGFEASAPYGYRNRLQFHF
ncbi:MAG: TRAM domain-containing protein, partial [Treponema sp.]|nr:TRAM domain-containing protein [Treponema sp.]